MGVGACARLRDVRWAYVGGEWPEASTAVMPPRRSGTCRYRALASGIASGAALVMLGPVDADEEGVILYPNGWRSSLTWIGPVGVGIAFLVLIVPGGRDHPAAALPVLLLALAMIP